MTYFRRHWLTAVVASLLACAIAAAGATVAAAAPAGGSPHDWGATCSAGNLGLDKDTIGLAPAPLGKAPDANPDGSPVRIAPDSRGRFIPVIMVHGWTSRDTHVDERTGAFSHLIDLTANRLGSANTTRSLIGQLQRIHGAAVFTFDYEPYAARWVDDAHLGPALGKVIDCLYRASGEKVIVVGHSMGGLITRYAAADRASEISTVVTFGTPEAGSVAAMLTSAALTASDNDVAAMLRLILSACGKLASNQIQTGTVCDKLPAPARAFASDAGNALRFGSSQLAQLRPFPRSISVDALAGGTTLQVPRVGWFALPWQTNSIDVGDLIVTHGSAVAGATQSKELHCAYQLSAVRGTTDAIGLRLGLTSKADAAQSLGSIGGPCFHTQLMRSIELTNEATGAVSDDIAHRNPLSPRFVDDWARHSTSLKIRADGTGDLFERTYLPCGTAPDCMYTAQLSVAKGPGATAIITYSKVSYLDYNQQAMHLTPSQHAELDPYFPLEGEQTSAQVDEAGRLILTPIGGFAARSKIDQPGNTYCGKATTPGETFDCGA